jgi:formamidase
MPSSDGAYVFGKELSTKLLDQIKAEGARTTPARENGGNIDCTNLSRGAMIFLPVFVQGANLSIGDLHFSLGDGEPTCAIEMAGIVKLRCSIMRNGLKIDGPLVMPNRADTLNEQQLVFYGLSLSEVGVQLKNDSTAAYIHAARRVMEWLGRFGYSREQAITILATAPIVTRILAVANTPTANVSIGIPIGIFSANIEPSAEVPKDQNCGSPAFLSEPQERASSAQINNRPPISEVDE